MIECGSAGELRPAKLKRRARTKDLLHWVCHTDFVEPLKPLPKT
jgi:hypothetical protein